MEEIITTSTSFDHRRSYSQNVSVDRTMRRQAQTSGEFALVPSSPSCLESEQELTKRHDKAKTTK